MNRLEVEYITKNKIEFLIDDSKDFSMLKDVDVSKYNKMILFFDKNVYDLYGGILENILGNSGKKIIRFIIEPEENSKSIIFYPEIIDFLEDSNANRGDLVFAIGGGIIIDAVSFSISTYMRGLDFYIIGTTLIGQTDASTAGKTCMNTRRGKNVLGTFYYPKIVYNNINVLKTNKPLYIRQGLSESFKYGLLDNEKLMNFVIEFYNRCDDGSLMKNIVIETIKSRINIRKIDPLASNLGHTFGHALESYFEYNILHGDAIAIGTVMALNFSSSIGIMEPTECEEICSSLKKAGLNVYIEEDIDVEKLVNLMRKDKKSDDNSLNLVLLEKIGSVYFHNNVPFYKVDYSVVSKFLIDFLNKYPFQKKDLPLFLRRDFL